MFLRTAFPGLILFSLWQDPDLTTGDDMATCFDTAEFFIANTDPDDIITDMKLQKLCAYAQAFALVLLGRPLFRDELKAFEHGPLIEPLYKVYRVFGKGPITTALSPVDVRVPFTPEELFILETVSNYYGAYTPGRLRNMSHSDFPGNFGSRAVIPHDEIRARFAGNAVVKAIQEAYADAV